MYTRWFRVYSFTLLVNCFQRINGEMEGFMVGALQVNTIEQYPYSASLEIKCHEIAYEYIEIYKCGSSIINQHFILTAGHCLNECNEDTTTVHVTVGNTNYMKGLKSTVHSFKVHERYSIMPLSYDIALVKLNTPLVLNSKVQRVALIKKSQTPVKNKIAFIAGWGKTKDFEQGKSGSTTHLMHAQLPLITRKDCITLMNQLLPEGTICAGNKTATVYAAEGDSGSALIIENNIQIGILSYRYPYIKTIGIYTDVGYFYQWIEAETANMQCAYNLHKSTKHYYDDISGYG